ncbi:MAG: hypothetical protein WC091_15240 [Sulfuricellaceae bacterium]
MTQSDSLPLSDDYDSPWKEALERYFPEFMAFYFPDAHNRIDWRCGYHACNTELRQVVRDAEIGERFADALMQVTLLTGAEEWLYIHVEVQGEREAGFARRMFTYNYRLYDRFDRPIASLAVLADDHTHWRPDRFESEALGCRHHFEFPVVKLIDYAPMIEPRNLR